MEEVSSNRLCTICANNTGKYTCPKCGTLYCSLTCYQSTKHQDCTEKFYKECVVEEMVIRQKEDDPQSRHTIVEALKKLKEQEENDDFSGDELDSDDTDTEEDLAARLAGIDLDNADAVWAKLSAQEKREFEQLLKSGEIHNLVEPWEPWWLPKKSAPLVEEIGNKPTTNPNKLPPIRKHIPDFSTVTSKAPSSDVGNNICNVLYAYALTARLYNGDHLDNSLSASELIFKLSSNLRLNQSFATSSEAVESGAFETTQHPDLEIPAPVTKTAKNDVISILKGPPSSSKTTLYALAALSDLHALLSTAKTEFASKDQSDERKRFPLALKKLDYYLSWLKSFGSLSSVTAKSDSVVSEV